MQADSSDDTNSMERHYAFNQCRVLVYGSFSESKNRVTFLASNQTEFLSIFYQKIDILSITGFFPRKFLK